MLILVCLLDDKSKNDFCFLHLYTSVPGLICTHTHYWKKELKIVGLKLLVVVKFVCLRYFWIAVENQPGNPSHAWESLILYFRVAFEFLCLGWKGLAAAHECSSPSSTDLLAVSPSWPSSQPLPCLRPRGLGRHGPFPILTSQALTPGVPGLALHHTSAPQQKTQPLLDTDPGLPLPWS